MRYQRVLRNHNSFKICLKTVNYFKLRSILRFSLFFVFQWVNSFMLSAFSSVED